MKKIHLMIVEDHQIVREGIVSLLKDTIDLEILTEATNGEDALTQMAQVQPHVIILDISMPHMDGLEFAATVREKFPAVKVLVLSMHLNEIYIKNALAKGVAGYLQKDISKQELIEAVRSVASDKPFFSSQVSGLMLQNYIDEVQNVKKPVAKIKFELTKREIQILKLLAEGMNSSEIGEKLFISKRTVDNHRLSLLQKLQVKNVAGLVKFAITHGLL
jgi:DNA-binding NarL/FixJ family response regulator